MTSVDLGAGTVWRQVLEGSRKRSGWRSRQSSTIAKPCLPGRAVTNVPRTLEDDLLKFDTRNAYEDGQDSRDDDGEWRNWRVDAPELDTVDEWDEDDGPSTPNSQSNH